MRDNFYNNARKQTHREYSGEERIKIMEEASKHGAKSTSMKYGVPHATIKFWRKYVKKFGKEKLYSMKSRRKQNNWEFQESIESPINITNEEETGEASGVSLLDIMMKEVMGKETNGYDVRKANIPKISYKTRKIQNSIGTKLNDLSKQNPIHPNSAPNSAGEEEEFKRFIGNMSKYDVNDYPNCIYIQEVKMQIALGKNNLVSLLFNEEISTKVIPSTQTFNFNIYLGFLNIRGGFLPPIFILDEYYPEIKLLGEELKERAIIYTKTEIPLNPLMEWIEHYVSQIKGQFLILHTINRKSTLLLPLHTLNTNNLITYMKIPSQIFHFMQFTFPMLQKAIIYNYFSEHGSTTNIDKIGIGVCVQRVGLLVESVLKSLSQLPPSLIIGCFSTFFSNLKYFQILHKGIIDTPNVNYISNNLNFGNFGEIKDLILNQQKIPEVVHDLKIIDNIEIGELPEAHVIGELPHKRGNIFQLREIEGNGENILEKINNSENSESNSPNIKTIVSDIQEVVSSIPSVF